MSEIRTELISNLDGSSPVDFSGQWALKASIDFDQSPTTIFSSNNVSALTDTGTGQIQISWINDFTDLAYPYTCAGGSANNTYNAGLVTKLTGSVTYNTNFTNGVAAFDFDTNYLMVNGVLA